MVLVVRCLGAGVDGKGESGDGQLAGPLDGKEARLHKQVRMMPCILLARPRIIHAVQSRQTKSTLLI